MIKGMREAMAAVIFPPRCPVCGGVKIPWEDSTCMTCSTKLAIVKEPRCLYCGREVIDAAVEYCPECMGKEHVLVRNFAVFKYDRLMKKSIADFKYDGRKEYAIFYAKNMAGCYGAKLQELGVQMLIPVPASRKRIRFRGFNQSELLAQRLSESLGIPMRPLLKRTKDTLPQNSLSKRERRTNLKEAFELSVAEWDALKEKPSCVAIVDDIYTTGSTLNACAKTLKSNGIEKIYGACVCVGGD